MSVGLAYSCSSTQSYRYLVPIIWRKAVFVSSVSQTWIRGFIAFMAS